MVDLQDSSQSMGMGDYSTKFKGMSDPEFAAYEAGRKKEVELGKQAQGEATKRAQSQIMADYGSTLFSKPAPKFSASQEDMSGFAALGSLLAVSGAMMGMKGKNSGIMAMNAISGMMKGYQQGRKDLYEQERQKFEASMKDWERERGQIKEAFDMALKMAPTNYKGATQFLNKTLASMGVDVPRASIERNGLTQTVGTYGQALDKAGNTAKAISARTGFRMSPQEQIALTQEEARREAEKKALGTGTLEYGQIEGVPGMYTREQIVRAGTKFQPLQKPSVSEATAAREAKIGAGPKADLAKMIGIEAAAATPEKTAEKIVGQVKSIKATMNLMRAAQDPEINFGELGRLSTVVSSAFDRNLPKDGVTSSTQAQAITNDSIDEAAQKAGLSPTDKNVVFYKKAVFTALELEREARGGSILPVAVMRSLGPLLDPKSMTREAYTAILKDRAEEVGRSTGFTQDQLMNALNAVPEISIDISTAPAKSSEPPKPSAKNLISSENVNKIVAEAKKRMSGRTPEEASQAVNNLLSRIEADGFDITEVKKQLGIQ
jgi:hypothetical protein